MNARSWPACRGQIQLRALASIGPDAPKPRPHVENEIAQRRGRGPDHRAILADPLDVQPA
jgi:hypothetical protein